MIDSLYLCLLAALSLLTLSCSARKEPFTTAHSAIASECTGDVTEDQMCDGYVQSLKHLTKIYNGQKGRFPGTRGWQEAQDHCANVLSEAGFEVTRQAFTPEDAKKNALEQLYVPYVDLQEGFGTRDKALSTFSGVNVIGRLKGSLELKGERIEEVLIGAHYDSVKDCTGADDNASGVAGVLEVARLVAPYFRAIKPQKSFVVACFDREENWDVGSGFYVQDAQARRVRDIQTMIFEGIGRWDKTPGSQRIPKGFDVLYPDAVKEVADGNYAGDFLTFAGNLCLETMRTESRFMANAAEVFLPFDHERKNVGLKMISVYQLWGVIGCAGGAPPDLLRSDHAPFLYVGMLDSFMLTDTSEFRNEGYHCRNGKDDELTPLLTQFALESANKVIRTTAVTAVDLLNEP